jgi:hypothetical protein
MLSKNRCLNQGHAPPFRKGGLGGISYRRLKIPLHPPRAGKSPFAKGGLYWSDLQMSIKSIKCCPIKRFILDRCDIGFLKTNEFPLRSVATSLFDVQSWTFDVRCSVYSLFPDGSALRSVWRTATALRPWGSTAGRGTLGVRQTRTNGPSPSACPAGFDKIFLFQRSRQSFNHRTWPCQSVDCVSESNRIKASINSDSLQLCWAAKIIPLWW